MNKRLKSQIDSINGGFKTKQRKKQDSLRPKSSHAKPDFNMQHQKQSPLNQNDFINQSWKAKVDGEMFEQKTRANILAENNHSFDVGS